MIRRRMCIILILVVQLLLCRVWAADPIGTFSVQNIFLRPELAISEHSHSRFQFHESFFSIEWRRDEKIKAFLSIGNELRRNLPVYYADSAEDKINFIEAYAQYTGVYGRIRAGLIPLQFGYDGKHAEDERIFDRTLVFSKRFIGLSDHGVSFYTEHNRYYTQLAVHNGEVDTESDGRLWASANWGYLGSENFQIGASIQTGHVKGQVSDGASYNAVLGVVDGEGALWRNGLLFSTWRPRNWDFMLQVGGGEYESLDRTGGYKTSTFEVIRHFTSNFDLGARYDALDPNNDLGDDSYTHVSLAFVFKTSDSSSKFIVLGTKTYEDDESENNDKLQVSWVLTPLAH